MTTIQYAGEQKARQAREIPSSTRRRTMPSGVAFYLQASIVVFFLAGSSVPTPLYRVYQAEWGFSPITTTVIFGIYAMAVLASLLTVGSLSDYIGRRPVILVAIAMQIVAMVIFDTAGGVTELLLARVVQGLSTGAAVGALGAGMLDLDRVKGTVANGVAPMTGTASGGLIAGVLVQYLPAPLHLVYLAFLAIFVLQGIGVLFMPETGSPKAGALASLRPQIGVPPAARRAMLAAIPALTSVWALAGFYGSLGPAVIRLVSGSSSFVLGGLTLFSVAGSGALTVFVARNIAPRIVMLVGAVSVILGVSITLVGISAASTAVFFIGSVIAGVGFGASFQGSLRTVLPLSEASERAGVLSTIFVVSYLAMGLPAVIGGFLVVHGGGVLTTAHEFGAAVIVLAVLALAGALIPTARRAQ
jgi:predicted MFS family arabinose efflux permease